MTLPHLLRRMHLARERRSAAADRTQEFEEATRELEELSTRIWQLEGDEGQGHDIALAVARLRAVQQSLVADKQRTEFTLTSARFTIKRARELLRRLDQSSEDAAGHEG
jgi:hypothetical protein